jgi:hypothetical protein
MYNVYDLARADKASLKTMYSDLLKERMRQDKFFSMFLEKFERRMDHEKTDTPIWKLYKKKREAYAGIASLIKSAEYQMRKF